MLWPRYSIYTLVDPRDGAVRYVGISKDIKGRYDSHCYASATKASPHPWLKDLKNQGLQPLLYVIEEGVGGDIAWERETYWIDFYLAEEEPLLNKPSRRKRRLIIRG